MKAATRQIDENVILDSMFTFFVNSGLENVSIREITKGTKIAQGSLYYWFGDKTNMICECTEYGLKKVADQIFNYVFTNMNNLSGFFANCLNEIGKYKRELRFIYQMAASPVYGEKIREKGHDFNFIYDKYTHKLSGVLGCDEKILRPLVYLFISAVLDYVVWEEKEKSQLQLDFIYSALPEMVKLRR